MGWTGPTLSPWMAELLHSAVFHGASIWSLEPGGKTPRNDTLFKSALCFGVAGPPAGSLGVRGGVGVGDEGHRGRGSVRVTVGGIADLSAVAAAEGYAGEAGERACRVARVLKDQLEVGRTGRGIHVLYGDPEMCGRAPLRVAPATRIGVGPGVLRTGSAPRCRGGTAVRRVGRRRRTRGVRCRRSGRRDTGSALRVLAAGRQRGESQNEDGYGATNGRNVHENPVSCAVTGWIPAMVE